MGSSSSKPSHYQLPLEPCANPVPHDQSLSFSAPLTLRQKQDAVIHTSSYLGGPVPTWDPNSLVLPERPPKPRRFSLKWRKSSQKDMQSPTCPPPMYPKLPLSPLEGNSMCVAERAASLAHPQSPNRYASVVTEPYWGAPPLYRESISRDAFTFDNPPARQSPVSPASPSNPSPPVLRKPLPSSRPSLQLQSPDSNRDGSRSLPTSPHTALNSGQVVMLSSSPPRPQLERPQYNLGGPLSGSSWEDPIDLTGDHGVGETPSGSHRNGSGQRFAVHKNQKKRHRSLYEKWEAPQRAASQRSTIQPPEVKADESKPNQLLPLELPDSPRTTAYGGQYHPEPSPRYGSPDEHVRPEHNPSFQPRRRIVTRESPELGNYRQAQRQVSPELEDYRQAQRQLSPSIGEVTDYNDSDLDFIDQEEVGVPNAHPENQLGPNPFSRQERSNTHSAPANDHDDQQYLQTTISNGDIADVSLTQSRQGASKRKRRRQLSHTSPPSPPYSGLYPRLNLPVPHHHPSRADTRNEHSDASSADSSRADIADEYFDAPSPSSGTHNAVDQETLDRVLAELLQEEEYAADIGIDLYGAIIRGPHVAPNRRLYDRGNTRPDTHAQRLGGVQGDDIHGGPSGTPTYDRIEQEEEDFKVAQQIQKEEFELIRQQAAQKTRDCVVCGDPTPIIAFPALPNCEHEPQTCADCYRGWIESELNHKAWNEIKCPEHKCKVILQHSDVQQYAAPEIYERFDQLSARSVLNDDPNFRWCRAPNCQSGQIHISGIEGNIFRCIACGHRICVIHEDTWHEGETCEEYDYRSSGKKERDQKQQNEASVQAISKLTKKCPGQNCGWNIEKNDGCDHMTCSKCRYEFCWVCLASYTAIRKKGNTAHRESCKYHSSKIR